MFSFKNEFHQFINFDAIPNIKVHGANMGPTWVLSAPHKWPVTRKFFHLMTSSWCVSQKLDMIRQVTTTGCFMVNEAKPKGQTSPMTTDRCNVMDAIFFTTKPRSFVVIDVLIIPNGNGQALNIIIPLLFELINSLSHIVPKDIGIDISRLLNAEVKIAEIRSSLTTICTLSLKPGLWDTYSGYNIFRKEMIEQTVLVLVVYAFVWRETYIFLSEGKHIY